MGSQWSAVEPRGYPIDFRFKAQAPAWPPPWLHHRRRLPYVTIAQRGLGSFERYVAGEGEPWRDAALGAAEWLLERQERGGHADGAWLHPFPTHTFPVRPPWVSAMAQGEAASLFVRVHRESGDERFADAAVRAIPPLRRHAREGGAMAEIDGGVFLEEYPTEPPSCVLNGGIFAIWGCLDVARALDDPLAEWLFERAVKTLSEIVERYDTGGWSRYDLFPHPITNFATPAYHRLHIQQLKAMAMVTGDPRFADVAARFEGYLGRRVNRVGALARKVLFRALIPTHRALVGRLPWDRALRETEDGSSRGRGTSGGD
jgi:heparosan-N-sulfate-glucuronate 5-epimerase